MSSNRDPSPSRPSPGQPSLGQPSLGRPSPHWTVDPIERARFLDGEGTTAERAERTREILVDPTARARVEAHRRLIGAIARGREALSGPSDLLALRVRAALAADRAAGFPSTGAGDSLPRFGRLAAFASAAAAVLVGVFVFSRGGESPTTSASERGVRLAAAAYRDGLGAASGVDTVGGTCEDGVSSPRRFPLVASGELSLSGCRPAIGSDGGGSESVSLLERPGDPRGRRGLVVMPWDGKTSATDVGYTRVGDVVVFDVNYGHAKYYLATRWESVAGTPTCAACHGPERAEHPTRNPHRIFERPLGSR